MIIFFTQEAWLKLRYFVEQCKTEISGFGEVEQRGDDFLVSDMVILDQIVSGAHSDMTDEALDKFVFEETKKKTVGKWKLWWHSHADMKAYFSAKDKATIESSTEFNWVLSLVTNHKMETEARIDQHKPFRAKKEDLEVRILEKDDKKLKTLCLKEIKKKVMLEPEPEVEEVEDETRFPYQDQWWKNKKKKRKQTKQERLSLEENEQDKDLSWGGTELKSCEKINKPWVDKEIMSVFIKEFSDNKKVQWVHVLYKNGVGKWDQYYGEMSLPRFVFVQKKK